MAIINTQIKGGGGVQPVGTLAINTNGVHNVAQYEYANVQVPTTAPQYYIKRKTQAGMLLYDPNAPIMNFDNITNFGDYALAMAFAYNVYTGSLDMSDVQQINGSDSCYQAFMGAKISSVDLSSLTSILGGYCCFGMFQNCTNLTTVNLSSLTEITNGYACQHMFNNCTNLTNVNLSSLTTISNSSSCQYMFYGCTSLVSVDLSSLTTISGTSACASMFENCSSLRTVDLSGLITRSGTNTIASMFAGCSSLEEVKLGDSLTKRNPTNILDNVPVRTCEYADKLEYITSSVTGLCRGNKFATANMKNFEMDNVSAQYMFANNTNLTNISFPVLTRYNTANAAAYMFSGCTNANFTHLYFPMLCVFRNAVPFTTTSFPSQLTIHFRKDQQTTITGTSGSSSAFGGNSLVFDLIGTITTGGVDYIYQATQNETGYKAWQKASSNITVGGVVYTFDMQQITRSTAPDTAGPILYGWTNGSTTIFTNSLKPQVGDYIWTAFNVEQSTTPITAVDNEYVYTVDNGEGGAEPAVGDTVYSDAQGTVLGTIDAVA